MELMTANLSGTTLTPRIAQTANEKNTKFAGNKHSKRLFHCHCGCGEQVTREEYLNHLGYAVEPFREKNK